MEHCRLLIFYWLLIVHWSTLAKSLPIRNKIDRGNSSIRTIPHPKLPLDHRTSNISSWKNPQKFTIVNFPPEDGYVDNGFKNLLGDLMSVNHEGDDEFYPYGMYPYMFAGTNPYQYGHCEAKIFQKEAALNNATKTNLEALVAFSPILTYILLWLYVEFLAILILPLVGFILFRFVALPLGEFIGGKRTRKYLRSLVIMIEKSRRDWIKWLWPKDRALPPWRFRTPKILRHDNEGSIPWELMEEKEKKKLNMQYPQRWQIEKRLSKWKEKTTNPECYADKWVFKMIRRKLLRDRSFYVASNKFKWGENHSSTSSGTSTTSDDETDMQQILTDTEQSKQSEKSSKFDLSLGTETMDSLSKLNLVDPKISKVTMSMESRNISRIVKQELATKRDDTYKKKEVGFKKRTIVDELYSLKSSHLGIILDQNDPRWPKYSGVVYEKGYDAEMPSKFKLTPWKALRIGLGMKKQYESAMKAWKKPRTKLVLKKREIDALARMEKISESVGSQTTKPPKFTYNLAVLEKIMKEDKDKVVQENREKIMKEYRRREPSTSTPANRTAKRRISVRKKPAKDVSEKRGSFFYENKVSLPINELEKQLKAHSSRKNSIKAFPSKKKNQMRNQKRLDSNVTTVFHPKILDSDFHKNSAVNTKEAHSSHLSRKSSIKEKNETENSKSTKANK